MNTLASPVPFVLRLCWVLAVTALLSCHGTRLVAGEKTPRSAFEVKAPNVTVRLSEDGALTGIVFKGGQIERKVDGGTCLAGCAVRGKTVARLLANGGVEFEHTWAEVSGGNTCQVIERFVPTTNSVRWEVEVHGGGEPWSVPIETHFGYPTDVSNSLVWAPWSNPSMGIRSIPQSGLGSPDEAPAKIWVPDQSKPWPRKPASMYDSGEKWTDPLLPRPFADATLYYGAPYFRVDKPLLAFAPFESDLIAIPLVSILEPKCDFGLSLVLSPEDPLLDLTLSLKADGHLIFRRLFHRISKASPVHYAADLIAHEADWRGGMRWMSARYREYFDPPNRQADAMGGTGAYSSSVDTNFDIGKLRRMAFRVNWTARFDFPYMGMFLPPTVDGNERWRSFTGNPASANAMNDYARRMNAFGFFVLSYFNITEFGTGVEWPLAPKMARDDPNLWKNGNSLLYWRLSGAILHVPDAAPKGTLPQYGKSSPGGPIYSWENSIAMDCGDPAYRDFLLEQARRQLDELPDVAGFAIDRMDWLRLYNQTRDDGVSWFDDRPAASLVSSWRTFMTEFGRLVHAAGKVIFVNNHDKRLDLLREVDGIFDEHTYGSGPLNLTAFLAIRKPALGWTNSEEDLRPDPDAFFQKYLYLGVYPMAPFPANDHSITPSPWADQQYEDYGPLLDVLRGKKWVLEPHVVEAEKAAAKVNLFEIPGGYALPVTYAGTVPAVDLVLRGIGDITDRATVEASFPGIKGTTAVQINREGPIIRLHVPVVRGCAMLRILTH